MRVTTGMCVETTEGGIALLDVTVQSANLGVYNPVDIIHHVGLEVGYYYTKTLFEIILLIQPCLIGDNKY